MKMAGFSRQKRLRSLIGVVTIFGSALLCGCYTQVTPPLNPVHPAVVYLCDYGVHSSLLLPMGPQRYVEYLYGDWNWAARGHTSALDAIGAVFFSQQSTLGQRFVDQLPGQSIPRPSDGPNTETPIIVNGDECSAVVTQLMQRWEQHRDTALPPASGMVFVKDNVPYNWTHDCNGLTADCLRDMGCRIDGFPIWSKFKIVAPAR